MPRGPPHRDPPRARRGARRCRHRVYTVTGELFFAYSNDLYTQFEYADDPQRVVIDLSEFHIWDASTVVSLDAITTKYERKGRTVEIVGSTIPAPNGMPSVRGELLRRLGRTDEARRELDLAVRLAANERERGLLQRKLAALG